MKRLSAPPSQPKQPYTIESFGGEVNYIPGTASVTRHLVTAKESEDAYLVCTGGGIASPVPVPFHYHDHTRHDFLCVKGEMKVWLEGKCRVLGPGDYASIAPKVIHSYQFMREHTENLGIVVPGGWEGFFRALGDPYDGPMWPDVDGPGSAKLIMEKAKKASEEFDVVPVPGYEASEPQAWDPSTDFQLRPSEEAYFLRNGTGPSAVLGGTVVRLINSSAQSGGTFTLGSIEGSSKHNDGVLEGHQFTKHHHTVYVMDGFLNVGVNGDTPLRIGSAETVFIPAGAKFDIKFDSPYAKMYVYSTCGGLVDALYQAGQSNPPVGGNCMIPQEPRPVDQARLRSYSE